MLTRVAPRLARWFRYKYTHVKLPSYNANVTMPDPNHGIKREILAVTRLKDRRYVTYELAVEKDTPLVQDFLQTFFIMNEPLCATVGLDADDAKAVIGAYISTLSFNVMAKVDENIVGVSCFALEEHKKQMPLPEWPADFGKLIDEGPTNRRKANIVLNYVMQCDKYIYHHVPAPSLLAHAALVNVHPAYQGQGIGMIMDVNGYKQAYKRGADYVVCNNTSMATNLMSKKLPDQKLIQQCELVKYLDYGKKPFENVIDGSKINATYIIDLKKSWSVYDKILKNAITQRS